MGKSSGNLTILIPSSWGELAPTSTILREFILLGNGVDVDVTPGVAPLALSWWIPLKPRFVSIDIEDFVVEVTTGAGRAVSKL